MAQVQAPKVSTAPRKGLSRRDRRLLVGGAALAIVVAVVLIVVSVTGSKQKTEAPSAVGGSAAVTSLLQGIPQSGIFLGSPSAPVTLIEYADLQCPYCAQWADQSLPTVVSRYVRAGKVRLEFRGLTFIGADSQRGLAVALAAGAQNRMWNVIDLIFRNQGTERSGWVTDAFLRSVLAGVPGLDAAKVLADRSSNAVADQMLAAEQHAQAAGISSTPSFQMVRKGGTPQTVHLNTLEPSGITGALDSALAG